MTMPLALLVYANLLPGSQLVNRLQDLGYRVQTLSQPEGLVAQAVQERPLLVILDLESNREDTCQAIRQLKANAATAHIPVLAYAHDHNQPLREAALQAGANIVASNSAILPQLDELIDHLLLVE